MDEARNMERMDRLMSAILRGIRVVPTPLLEAVQCAARDLWPAARAEEIEVRDYRQGVLHVGLDSHARLAEARSFLSEEFRRKINENLGRSTAPREGHAPAHGAATEGLYVAKLMFHVRGTR
jgi:hypothetical protein